MSTQSPSKTLTLSHGPGLIGALDAERLGTLTVLVGSDVGATFMLNRPSTLVGRGSDAQVALIDDGISRNHARIVRIDDRYEIEDLGSTNGSYVGGQRVSDRQVLEDGARVQFGKTILRFAVQDCIEREATRRIYEMSVRDGLTGVFNRRYFEERMTAEFAFAARHGTALSVLLVDIDHFKQINDRWGHQAGDFVLQRVSAALRNSVRTEDVLARYGGEEFVILARGIDAKGTRLFAERMRAIVERTQIQWQEERIPVTVSLGMAHNHTGAPATKGDRLVAAADQALYAAKRAGRNRAEMAESPSRYSAGSAEDSTVVGPSPAPSAQTHERAPQRPRERYWEKATAPSDELKGTAARVRAPAAKRER